MRRAAILIAAAGLLGALAQPAAAQFQYGNMNQGYNGGGFGTASPNYGSRTGTYPALSPYLDIVRGGNPAINYFLGTRAEFDRRNFQGSMLSTLPALGAGSGQPQPGDLGEIPTLPQTGHMAAFGAYGSYYPYGSMQRPYYPLNMNQGMGSGGAAVRR